MPAVVRWARLPEDVDVQDEQALVEREATLAGLAAVDVRAAQLLSPPEVVERVRAAYQSRLPVWRPAARPARSRTSRPRTGCGSPCSPTSGPPSCACGTAGASTTPSCAGHRPASTLRRSGWQHQDPVSRCRAGRAGPSQLIRRLAAQARRVGRGRWTSAPGRARQRRRSRGRRPDANGPQAVLPAAGATATVCRDHLMMKTCKGDRNLSDWLTGSDEGCVTGSGRYRSPSRRDAPADLLLFCRPISRPACGTDLWDATHAPARAAHGRPAGVPLPRNWDAAQAAIRVVAG